LRIIRIGVIGEGLFTVELKDFGRKKFKGPNGSSETWGMGDPSITFHAKILEAHALTIEKFPNANTQTKIR
jgi:hypothetical protein